MDQEFVLELFSDDKRKWVKRYIDFAEAEEIINIPQIKNEEKILGKIKDEDKLRQTKSKISYKDIKKEVCKLTGISEEEIMRKNRV